MKEQSRYIWSSKELESFLYRYDFGDDWHHDILLEAIMLAEPDAVYPRCIGYTEYAEAVTNPAHDRHEELIEWNGPFDPDVFSLAQLRASLQREFVRPKPKQKSPDRAHGRT